MSTIMVDVNAHKIVGFFSFGWFWGKCVGDLFVSNSGFQFLCIISFKIV